MHSSRVSGRSECLERVLRKGVATAPPNKRGGGGGQVEFSGKGKQGPRMQTDMSILQVSKL